MRECVAIIVVAIVLVAEEIVAMVDDALWGRPSNIDLESGEDMPEILVGARHGRKIWIPAMIIAYGAGSWDTRLSAYDGGLVHDFTTPVAEILCGRTGFFAAQGARAGDEVIADFVDGGVQAAMLQGERVMQPVDAVRNVDQARAWRELEAEDLEDEDDVFAWGGCVGARASDFPG